MPLEDCSTIATPRSVATPILPEVNAVIALTLLEGKTADVSNCQFKPVFTDTPSSVPIQSLFNVSITKEETVSPDKPVKAERNNSALPDDRTTEYPLSVPMKTLLSITDIVLIDFDPNGASLLERKLKFCPS